ncbi:MAG TPA: hypothetical protein VHE30_03250 [Polyangiaceae bacterium]|nr:hypothetical protein [Polyangiaceae bacterium]
MKHLALPPALLFLLLSGCRRESEPGSDEIRRAYIGPETHAVAEPSAAEKSRRACEARMREVLSEPEVPGVPALEAHRAAFLARAKAEPVLFVSEPRYSSEPASLTVRGYRQMLEGKNAWGVVEKILDESAPFPKQARDSILRDGYLYADQPELAYALVSLVSPHQLFGQDRIWIERGEHVLHAERKNGRFYYSDGPMEGERARFVLFDRAGAGEEPPPPLHRDLRTLRYALHFEAMKIGRVTDNHIVATLKYGKTWVPTVLATKGAHVELECETLDPGLVSEVANFRAVANRRERAVQSLRRSMLLELEEALPFDEPLHEYGFQLDGTLRRKWVTAYKHGRDRFAFNGDPYQVFDPRGRPLAPQVCVDFLTDTLERTCGTWFRPRGDTPGRVTGKLDFDALPGVDRLELRRVPGFVAFAKARPDWFEVLDDPERIPMGDRDAFLSYLERHASDFQPGDAVLIKGKTPWDANHVHFHSFFIYESDPVTGMPLVVVGNAGRPSLRSWETEIRRTPARSILHRIRFETSWLESVATLPPLEGVPPLAAGPE